MKSNVFHLVFTLIILFVPKTTGAQGIPSPGIQRITAPITTGFGVYTPYPVPEYQPPVRKSEPYPANDFSNVITLTPRFSWNSFFTVDERKKLQQFNMVLRPESYSSFAQGYTNSGQRIVNFISVDAVMHGLRVIVDESYRQAEREKLIPILKSLLDDLSGRLGSQLQTETHQKLLEPTKKAFAIIQTARNLLDPSDFQPDQRVADDVALEVSKIASANTTETSAILKGRQINYAAFVPQGYYKTDETLSGYYRALVWLNQGIYVPAPANAASKLEELRTAILLARLFDLMLANEDTKKQYQTFVEVVLFFNGRQNNDVSPEMLAGLVRGYFGRLIGSSTSQVSDDQQLLKFAAYTDRQSPPYTLQPDGSRHFAIFPVVIGDRSVLFDKFCSVTGGTDCLMQLLDALGMAQSDDEPDTGSYTSDLRTLIEWYKKYPSEEWARSIEHALIYTTLPMLQSSGDNEIPRFIQSDAWQAHRASSIYGSLGVFGRTTVPTMLLQSATAKPTPGEELSHDLRTDGYVEPAPELWSRLASLAGYLRSGFASRASGSLISKDIAAKLEDVEKVCVELMRIATQELSDKPCSRRQLQLIATMPARIAAYETFTQKLPVTADGLAFVALNAESSANTNTLFGTPVQPIAVYVIVPRNDSTRGLMLARGTVFGYKERSRSVPSDIFQFISADKPLAPDVSKFRSYATVLPPYPQQESSSRAALPPQLHIVFESNVVRKSSGELWFTVNAPKRDGTEIRMQVVNLWGQIVLPGHAMFIENGQCYDMLPVESLTTGQYFLRVNDGTGNLVASGHFSVVQ